ncbi:MAG TPA: NAD(P)H-dependent oxidoreductase [Dongiaceae bacterium]|nr:NAD(P)H-dependent oxidoreductase [Dongiaceae bacterium]
MHVLVIFAHPRRDSFTGAALDSLLEGLGECRDHTIEIADLYRENFEPRFQPEDYAQFRGEAMPEPVRREQERFDRCDAVAFVFPVWWWSFPAALKGWIDRVFSEGWAYNFEPGMSRGRLRDRPTLVLGVAGSRESTYRKYGYGEAMRVQIDVGILGYCGLRDVETHILFDVEQSAENRSRCLSEAREIGRMFLSPGRRRRVPELGSDRPA